MSDAAPADTATTDTASTSTDTSSSSTGTPPADTANDATDWKAEAEKWQGLARKHEDRAKANAEASKELEKLRRQGMSDLEAAVDEAKTGTRVEVLTQVGGKLVDAEVRAALAGRNVDVDAVLEGLDRSVFLGDDLEPNRDAITAWADRVAPKPAEPDKPDALAQVFDLGQGARANSDALNGDPLLQGIKSKLGIK